MQICKMVVAFRQPIMRAMPQKPSNMKKKITKHVNYIKLIQNKSSKLLSPVPVNKIKTA